jgi:transmembrane sensor
MKPTPEPSETPDRNRGSAAAIRQAAADWVVRHDAGLAPDEARAFQSWLQADPRHGAAWARLNTTWGALDGPRRAGMADWVMLEISGRIRRRRRRRVGAALGGLAAVLALALVGRTHFQPAGALAPAPTIVVTQPRQQVLPDGSVVELKDGADIAVDFSGVYRRIALRRGEALFRVAKNPQRPFVVQVGEWEVRAVGTEFSVEFGSGEVGVLVTEGRVAVNQAVAGQSGPASAPRTLAYIDAGNRLTVKAGVAALEAPRVVAISENEINERLAWASARLEFSNTPLAEAVALMNRHNRLQFVIEDPSLAGVRVSGFIRADNAEDFARFLEAYFPVKAERRGESEMLLRHTP